MNKYQLVKQLKSNGDSIISVRGIDDMLVTLDFSAKYIKRKKTQRFTILRDCILLFSWTENKFMNIKVNDIRHVTPLSKILNNESPEITIDG